MGEQRAFFHGLGGRGGVVQVAVEQRRAADAHPAVAQPDPDARQRFAVPDHPAAGLRHAVALDHGQPRVPGAFPQPGPEGSTAEQDQIEGPQPLRDGGIPQGAVQLSGHQAYGVAITGGGKPFEVGGNHGRPPARHRRAHLHHQPGHVTPGQGQMPGQVASHTFPGRPGCGPQRLPGKHDAPGRSRGAGGLHHRPDIPRQPGPRTVRQPQRRPAIQHPGHFRAHRHHLCFSVATRP